MMRKYESMATWEATVSQEPWLDGLSLQETTLRLAVSEQQLGELLLKGKLSVSYIHEYGKVVKAVIPLNDVQTYRRRNRALFVGPNLEWKVPRASA